MRIPLDPVPLVAGIYAYVGQILFRASERREDDAPEALGRRFSRRRADADREVQRMVRSLHADVKIADKLLRKTGDVWKISRETDLVDLVLLGRGEEPAPQAYVLLTPDQARGVLGAIAEAARGAGEAGDVVDGIQRAAAAVQGRASEYLTFGFDPWHG
jgi:hypothetical protein